MNTGNSDSSKLRIHQVYVRGDPQSDVCCIMKCLLHFDYEHIMSVETMPRLRIRVHYEPMLQFERGRSIGVKEAGWTK